MSSLRSAAIRIANELPKGDETRRRLLTAISREMKQWQRAHPHHSELALIADQRRTWVGDGRFEVPAQIAGLLAKQKLVDIVHMPGGGRTLDLTRKGRQVHDSYEESFALEFY